MSKAERQDLDRRIQDEPALQRELAGFRAFKLAVRDAGLVTDVPDDRLTRALSSVVGSKPKPVRPSLEKWALRLSPVFGILLAYAVVTNWPTEDGPSAKSIAIAVNPPIAHCKIVDPDKAVAWMNAKLPFQVPKLTLAGHGTLTGVKAGTDWAAWQFDAQEHQVNIFIAKRDPFEGAPYEDFSGTRLYKSPWGLGWRQGGFSYYVDGCNHTALREVAAAAQAELPK